MPKNNRSGQASIFEPKQFQKLIANTSDPKWRLFWQIAYYTGERCGAVAQLKVRDVFDHNGNPLSEITYRAITRKKSAGHEADTRQVAINSTLKAILAAYLAPSTEFLFPGGFGDSPIKPGSVQAAMVRSLAAAGLGYGGFSTHSFRRTFITRMAEKGVSVKVMQRVTGHKDIKSLMGYVEVSPAQEREAVEMLA